MMYPVAVAVVNGIECRALLDTGAGSSYVSAEWADCIMGKILKKVEIGKFITTALKSILKLVKLQSLVAKHYKVRKM